MAKTRIWIPLYVDDYESDTWELTMAQSGCYLHLLMRCWKTGPLPDDDAKLAGICRMSKTKWVREIAPAVRPFFHKTEDGRLSQKRLEIEREKARKNSEQKKAAADAKWQKEGQEPSDSNELTCAAAYASADAAALQTHPSRICPTPSPSEERKKEPATQVASATADGQPGLFPPEPKAKATPKPKAEEPPAKLALWREGVPIYAKMLGLHPKHDKAKIGGELGAMLKVVNNDYQRVLDIIVAAERAQPMDPQEWIWAAVRRGPRLVVNNDPDDHWGISAWCRSIPGVEPAVSPGDCARGKWMAYCVVIDACARQVAEAAGLPPTWRGDWTLLGEWLAAGHSDPDIVEVVTKIAGRVDCVTSLRLFDEHVRRLPRPRIKHLERLMRKSA